MTNYQMCHTHYGYLTRETATARELLERCGKPDPQTVKELRRETDMPMAECARMLRCMWRDAELEHVQSENARLRELIADVRDALRADKAGMFHKLILASMEDDMRELGMEVN